MEQSDYLDRFPHREKQIKAFYRDVAKCKKLSFEESQVNKSMRKVTPGE